MKCLFSCRSLSQQLYQQLPPLADTPEIVRHYTIEINKKIRATVGDIFQIPIDENRMAFGQVVANKRGVLRVLTFKATYCTTDTPSVDEILQKDILLLTDTMDAKIYNGDWKIYGNAPVRVDLPKPRFKFGLDPIYVTEYESKPNESL